MSHLQRQEKLRWGHKTPTFTLQVCNHPREIYDPNCIACERHYSLHTSAPKLSLQKIKSHILGKLLCVSNIYSKKQGGGGPNFYFWFLGGPEVFPQGGVIYFTELGSKRKRLTSFWRHFPYGWLVTNFCFDLFFKNFWPKVCWVVQHTLRGSAEGPIEKYSLVEFCSQCQ